MMSMWEQSHRNDLDREIYINNFYVEANINFGIKIYDSLNDIIQSVFKT